MKHKIKLVTLLFSIMISFIASGQQNQKPNVVFILADNVGYGDMGPYGGGELRGMPTPRTDKLASEGMRFTQYMVEPGCTPSRTALMTGQYSIRNGLSLIGIPGSPNTLPQSAYTMGQLFKEAGYATAMYGKWHLGDEPQSVPTAHGFDSFYGLPPNTSWNDCISLEGMVLTHSFDDVSESVLVEQGPWIVSQVAGGPMKRVKPFTPEVRAEIDHDLTDRSIDFIKQQKAAGKPFFLYLPFSMGHAPNYPSKQFAGKSRSGNYGDKIMEGDYHVGQILDALKELNLDNNTIVVFASDNGPWGWEGREMGNLGTPDMGSPGPFRGELGEVTEGSIRTFCFVRWSGHIAAGSTSYAMFSEMDFLPTFAKIIGSSLPADRPFDGIDQSDVLLGKSKLGNRESLLSFVGSDLLAVRWKQWRVYFTEAQLTGSGPQMVGGMFISNTAIAYPKVFNIEMDPHEDLNLGGIYTWVWLPALKVVGEYKESLKKYPNPPAGNLTKF